MNRAPCFQLLTLNGRPCRCIEPRGTEHDHSDPVTPPSAMDLATIHDYVVAHGYGAPTPAGIADAAAFLMEEPCGYAEAASDVVFKGLTVEAA